MGIKKHNLIPDFLIIGAGKSGTTSLDKYLSQHPDIFIPRKKEPNFYGYEHVSIDVFQGDQQEISHFKNSITTLEDYLNLFREAAPGQLIGETSNTYMYHDQAPCRIKHYNPAMKLIAILRHPAERLYSRFLHLARINRLPSSQFADCLDKNTIYWRRNDLIREGFYFKNLTPYYALFPNEQIKVLLYEDLKKKPEEVMYELFSFLGVDNSFMPDMSVKYNESGIVKNQWLNKIYGEGGLLTRSIRSILPETVIKKLRSNVSLIRKVNELRNKNLEKPIMDPAIRKSLTFDVYGEDIQKLQQLINRDLSHWLR
jgi:hypothetical protein